MIIRTAGEEIATTSENPPDTIALALLLAFLSYHAITGFMPTVAYGHDIFVSLDGGWRILNGQRPHLDFFTALGPIWYLLTAAGLKLSGGKATEAIGFCRRAIRHAPFLLGLHAQPEEI